VQQHLGDGMSINRSRLKVVRAASAAITLASVGVLSLVVAESGGTVSKHTVITRHVVHTKVSEALPVKPASTSTASSAAPVPSTSESTSATTPAAKSTVVTSAATTVPTPSVTPTSSTPSAPTTATSLPGVTANALPACPLGLSAPANSGGLQSLIGFAPVFGPFSAEAFASAAAFQPVLELIGPFLVAFAHAYAPYSTAFAPLLNTIETLENLGYATLLEPLTAAYQTQLLTAETQLATALAPGASALLDNPASSCVVDIEGLLTGNS
jgi:hypothetical protein